MVLPQRDLFGEQEQPEPVDTHLAVEEKVRLRGKVLAVLEQLRKRPTTNIDLISIGGIRASARIHDLRKFGYTINASHQGDGIWLYTLIEETNKNDK